MFRKIISALLLLIILSGPVPVANAQAPCPSFGDTVKEEMKLVISPGGIVTTGSLIGVFVLDAAISLLKTKSIAGFQLGGIVEPLDHALEDIKDFLLTIVVVAIVAAAFNLLAGALIDAALDLNFAITQNNPLVELGGRVMLQLANFGLVLAIIVIGIATILRLKEDKLSADKLLVKLIVGIALVNLTIPAMSGIVNLGTTITKSMFEASSPCPGGLSQRFTPAQLSSILIKAYDITPNDIDLFDSEKLMPPVPTQPGIDTPLGRVESPFVTGFIDDLKKNIQDGIDKILGFFSDLLISILLFYVSIVISAVAALTFLAFAIFLIIRYVIITLLLIFSPLIWFGFIFSDFKISGAGNIWNAWWSNFLKWVFFGPIIILFLIFTAQYLDAVPTAHAIGTTSAFLVIGQLIAAIIISALGLYFAFKFSAIGGGLVMAGVSGAVGFAIGKTQNLMKGGQLWGESLSKRAALRGSEAKAVGFKAASQFFKTKGVEGTVGKNAMSLLNQVGIKPSVKTISEDELRRRQAIMTAGITSNISPKSVLAMSEEDIKKLPEGEKEAVARAAYKLRQQYTNDPSSLQPGEVVALNKLEKILYPNLVSHIAKDPALLTNPENVLTLANYNPSSTDIQSWAPDVRKRVVAAIRNVQGRYAIDPAAFQPEQVIALRKLEKLFAPDLADLKIRDIQTDPNTGAISDAEAIKVLSLTKAEMNNISPDDKAKAVAAVYSAQSQYARDPTAFQSRQVVALRAFTNILAPDLASLKMQNIQADPNTGAISDAEAITVLSLTKAEMDNISPDDKAKAVAAVYSAQSQYARDPTVFQSPQVVALRAFEKLYPSELIGPTMRDVEAPSGSVIGVQLSADELNRVRPILRLTNESASEIVRNGTSETIEKSIQAILAITNETQVNSKVFTRAELGRSQSLQRIFSEKIINYTLDNLDPLTNPESVLHLSNNQLFQIGRSFGTQTDKQNIERALEILNERKHLMNDKQLAELNRVSARVHVLKKTKQEW